MFAIGVRKMEEEKKMQKKEKKEGPIQYVKTGDGRPWH